MNIELIFQNEQERVDVTKNHETLIKTVIEKTLEEQGFLRDCSLSVTITDNENIRDINREYRNIDLPTDVLSFPVLEFDEFRNPIENIGDVYEGKILLGDIVVSFERAMEQSEEYGHSFERELGFLICHSVLHLLGHDHENDDERKIMRKHEEAVLSLIKLTRGD